MTRKGEEFERFCASTISSISISVSAIALTLLPIFDSANLVKTNDPFHKALSIIVFLFLLVVVVLTWLLWLIVVKNNYCGRISAVVRYLSNAIVIIGTLTVCGSLLNVTVRVGQSKFNEYRNDDELPDLEFFVCLLTPILFSVSFKAAQIEVLFACWTIVEGTCFGLILRYNLFESWGIFCVATVPSLIILYECYRQARSQFATVSELKHVLKENERLAEEARAMELRHMIGNVAHDLKTPLSGFMAGVDTLGEVLTEAVSPDELFQKVSFLKSAIDDMRNINNFMLMTINRCIDYTKASKGMVLVPKLETIKLADVLNLPLRCMRSMQKKIDISLSVSPAVDVNHIITDKQWLQENVLCLLSNAVKYSGGGSVALRVSKMASLQELSAGRQRFVQIMEANVAKTASEDSDAPSRRSSVSSIHALTSSLLQAIARESSPSPAHQHYKEERRIFPTTSCESLELDRCICGDKNNSMNFLELPHSDAAVAKLTGHEHLLIEVEDSGIGLTDEKMQSLFRPFKQAQRMAGGTGLGLFSLAKRIEALHGVYGVERRSTDDDEQGSVFWFTIPLRIDDVAEELSCCSSQQCPASLASGIVRAFDPPACARLPAPMQAKEEAPRNLLVLLVDDSPTIQKMTSMILRRQCYTVDQAENGAEAVDKFRKACHDVHYDVVFMDLQMPVMDGFEATRRIREKEKTDYLQYGIEHHQFIIGLSANSDVETMNEAFAAGIDDFISKPFSFTAFVSSYNKFQKMLHPVIV